MNIFFMINLALLSQRLMFLPFQRSSSSVQVRFGAYPKFKTAEKWPGSEVRSPLDRNDDIDDVERRGQKSGPEA